VIGLGTWELSQGHLTLGGLLVFMTFLTPLYSPVRGMSRLVNRIHAASAAAERIIEMLDQKPSVVESSNAVKLACPNGGLELDQVAFRYPDTERHAVSGVSLTVEPGEVLALVGPSGAGKSTLAKLLLRFYDPQFGIGATLYEAATGARPFPDATHGTYPQAERRAASVAESRRAPADFTDLLDACLAPKPSERPSVSELADGLDAVIGD
jgi:hypothetical protein